MITNQNDYCVLCGKPKDHTHHLIGGSFRKTCDRYDLVVPLCFHCHEEIHRSGISEKLCKIIGQMQWEKENRSENDSDEDARIKFMNAFGRSWL